MQSIIDLTKLHVL